MTWEKECLSHYVNRGMHSNTFHTWIHSCTAYKHAHGRLASVQWSSGGLRLSVDFTSQYLNDNAKRLFIQHVSPPSRKVYCGAPNYIHNRAVWPQLRT